MFYYTIKLYFVCGLGTRGQLKCSCLLYYYYTKYKRSISGCTTRSLVDIMMPNVAAAAHLSPLEFNMFSIQGHYAGELNFVLCAIVIERRRRVSFITYLLSYKKSRVKNCTNRANISFALGHNFVPCMCVCVCLCQMYKFPQDCIKCAVAKH